MVLLREDESIDFLVDVLADPILLDDKCRGATHIEGGSGSNDPTDSSSMFRS